MTASRPARAPLDHLVRLPGLDPLPPGPAGGPHLFTVDVEEYYQVSALEPYLPRERWASMPGRLEAPMERMLEMLAAGGHRATFFVLGCVAERHRALVRRLREAGHEVASHGESHRRVPALGPKGFREEIRASKARLEEITGAPVLGYRAPSFSIVPGTEWALDLLLEEGYRYDSSLFPVRRRGYGHPGALARPHWIPRLGGRLLEVPPTTREVAGARLPTGGGGYFRLFPYAWTAAELRRRARLGIPAVFYLHPWEIDPGQPRLGVPLLTRARHYGGLRRVEGRLERLLREFRFTSVERAFAARLEGRTLRERVPA